MLDMMLRRQRFAYLKMQFSDHARRQKEMAFLLFSTLPFFPDLLGWPFETIALVKSSPLQTTTIIQAIIIQFGLTASAILWIHAFQDAIGGSKFYDYLRTLPIRRERLDRPDLAVLIVSNIPFWIMVAMALINAPFKQMPFDDISLFIVRIVLAITLLIYIQAKFLRRHKSWILSLILMIVVMNVFGFLPYNLHIAGLLIMLLIFIVNYMLTYFSTDEVNKS